METHIMKNGIYTEDELSIDDYHLNKSHVSASGLKAFQISPTHFELTRLMPSQRKTHFDFGHAAEIKLLDADKFDAKVYVINSKLICDSIGGLKPKATKDYKMWKVEELKIAGNRYVIEKHGPESMDSINEIDYACKNDKLVSILLKNTQAQVSCLWTDEKSGVNLKTRPDLVHVNKNIIIDVKTTVDASPWAFARSAAKYNYPIQAVTQIDGVVASGLMDHVDLYYYLTIQKSAPYMVQLYRMTDEDIQLARDKVNDLLTLFSLYQQGKIRHGYNFQSDDKHGIMDLNIPQYYWYD